MKLFDTLWQLRVILVRFAVSIEEEQKMEQKIASRPMGASEICSEENPLCDRPESDPVIEGKLLCRAAEVGCI